MKNKKLMRLLAFGLLLMSGSNLIARFVFPVNDFILGAFNGIGLGLMLLSLYRMKYKTST